MSANPLTPLDPAQTTVQEDQTAHERYVHRVLVGLDQFLNVLTDGDPDETISSRAARAAEKKKPWGVALSKFLNLFQHDHGAKAQAGDFERAEAVAKLETESGEIHPKE